MPRRPRDARKGRTVCPFPWCSGWLVGFEGSEIVSCEACGVLLFRTIEALMHSLGARFE